MNDKILWIAGPALFSVIGMIAGYLTHTDYTIGATFVGGIVGFVVTTIAMAGEKPNH